MTLGAKPLTRKPGEFYGVCRLTKPHPIKDLPPHLQRAMAENGWPKGWRNVYNRKAKRELRTECYLEPLCDGIETSDRAAFDAHMKEAHGRNEVKGHWESIAKSVRAGWRPVLKSRRDVVAAHDLQVCPGCGLSAEVGDRAADTLWWHEHLTRCRGTGEAGAA